MPVSLALLYKNQRGAPILPDQYTPQRLHSFSRLGAKIHSVLRKCNLNVLLFCNLVLLTILNEWNRTKLPGHSLPSLWSILLFRYLNSSFERRFGKENALLWAEIAIDRSLRDHGTVATLTFLNYE